MKWNIADRNRGMKILFGPFDTVKEASAFRSKLEAAVSEEQNERWNLWVIPARKQKCSRNKR